jgi:hypothetical protein
MEYRVQGVSLVQLLLAQAAITEPVTVAAAAVVAIVVVLPAVTVL